VSFILMCKGLHTLSILIDRFYNIDPSRFQKGDIVEVSISFFCVKTRSGTAKMMISLKSLILLDDSFREVKFLHCF
jgi:hypothetical protein